MAVKRRGGSPVDRGDPDASQGPAKQRGITAGPSPTSVAVGVEQLGEAGDGHMAATMARGGAREAEAAWAAAGVAGSGSGSTSAASEVAASAPVVGLPSRPVPHADALVGLAGLGAPVVGDEAAASFGAACASFVGSEARPAAYEAMDAAARAAPETWFAKNRTDYYLRQRGSLTDWNYYFWTKVPEGVPSTEMAAAYLHGYANYWTKRAPEPGNPQLDLFLGSKQIAGEAVDTLNSTPGSLHAIVCYKNKYYVVQVREVIADASGGERVRPRSAEAILRDIESIKAADAGNAADDLGAFSTLKRADVAAARALLDDEVRGKMDTALMCVTLLDEDCELSKQWVYGDIDRNSNIVISPTTVTQSFVHAGFDGGTALYAATKASDFVDASLGELRGMRPCAVAGYIAPKVLAPGRDCAEQCRQASVAREAYVDTVKMQAVELPLGSREIKAKGLSPDAVYQAVINLAYYAASGVFRNGYESVALLGYNSRANAWQGCAGGRVEGAWVASEPMRELAGIFDACEWTLAGDDTALKERVMGCLGRCAGEHRARIGACKEGKGPVRHLDLLREFAPEAAAEILEHPALAELTNYGVVSSACPSAKIGGFGYAGCAGDTIGVGYNPGAESVMLTVSHQGDDVAETTRRVEAFQVAVARVCDLIKACF